MRHFRPAIGRHDRLGEATSPVCGQVGEQLFRRAFDAFCRETSADDPGGGRDDGVGVCTQRIGDGFGRRAGEGHALLAGARVRVAAVDEHRACAATLDTRLREHHRRRLHEVAREERGGGNHLIGDDEPQVGVAALFDATGDAGEAEAIDRG